MDDQELSLLVKSRSGLRTAREARRALVAAVGALRCALDPQDARDASRGLPPALAAVMGKAPSVEVRGARALYAEAARREQVDLGFAMEHAQVVFQVLAQELDPELLVRLRKRLPPDVAALLRPRAHSPEPPPHVHVHPDSRPAPAQTLSRARPGTAEPIAEAHHELAHAGSVARSETAHADRMVETAHTTRPGLEDDTLAATRRGSRRP